MDYPALLAVLQQHANPERAVVPMQAYMKHRFTYFGIGKPQLAHLCSPFFKGAAKQPVDWDFVRRCWDDPHRELQYAALEYLKKMQQRLTPQDIPRLQTLITEKSWWDSADVLDRIVGDIALRHPEVNIVLLAWSTDDNIWLRRVTIDHQLLRKQHPDTALLEKSSATIWGKKNFSSTKPSAGHCAITAKPTPNGYKALSADTGTKWPNSACAKRGNICRRRPSENMSFNRTKFLRG